MRFFHQFYIVLLFCLLACTNEKNENGYEPVSIESSQHTDGYLGDSSCKACHQEAFDDWEGKSMELCHWI